MKTLKQLYMRAWLRYRCARLFYVAGRIEGLPRSVLVPMTVFELLRPTPLIRATLIERKRQP